MLVFQQCLFRVSCMCCGFEIKTVSCHFSNQHFYTINNKPFTNKSICLAMIYTKCKKFPFIFCSHTIISWAISCYEFCYYKYTLLTYFTVIEPCKMIWANNKIRLVLDSSHRLLPFLFCPYNNMLQVCYIGRLVLLLGKVVIMTTLK